MLSRELRRYVGRIVVITGAVPDAVVRGSLIASRGGLVILDAATYIGPRGEVQQIAGQVLFPVPQIAYIQVVP